MQCRYESTELVQHWLMMSALLPPSASRRSFFIADSRGACPARAEDDPYGVKSTDGEEGHDPNEKLEYQSERQWTPKEDGGGEDVWVERFDSRTQRKFWWNTV